MAEFCLVCAHHFSYYHPLKTQIQYTIHKFFAAIRLRALLWSLLPSPSFTLLAPAAISISTFNLQHPHTLWQSLQFLIQLQASAAYFQQLADTIVAISASD